jgi:outer membrane protein assembly factor BamB
MLRLALVLIVVATSPLASGQLPENADQNWHQWRGPLASGEAPQGNPPTEWGPDTNIVWKTPIAGRGSSSPVVYGDRIYVASAVESKGTTTPAGPTDPPQPPEQRRRRGGFGGGGFGRGGAPTTEFDFVVTCVNRESGDVIWTKTATTQVPHEGTHSTNTYASASPITDGKHVWVSFGSFGIYCFDVDGNEVWNRDLGDMQTRNSFGEGASPALYGNTLVVPWDHEGDSFVVALDAKTGGELWKKDRDEATTWNTPLILEAAGKTQVILNGANRTRSYDLATGDLIWECGGQTVNPIPSPIAYKDMVLCMSGYRGEAFYAISLASKGDVSESSEVAWTHNRGTSYVPSALLMSERLYFTKGNNGILTILDANTGEALVDQKRLPDVSQIYASPVGAAGKVYITSRDGKTLVIADAPEYQQLAINDIGEPVDASPAIVGDKIYIRGENHLFCIGE